MKLSAYSALLALVAISCNTTGNNENETSIDPETVAAGTLIAADSVLIIEDELNKPYFSVKVYTTANTANGTYRADIAWNKNTATTKFTMPKSEKKLTPILRRVPDQYAYHIGFHYGDDTTFYDYYEIQAEKGMIKTNYLKAYKFE
jgi:hypothetical protein